jgi:hypothetical protein
MFLSVYVKLSIVLIAYNILILLLRAIKEDKEFIWLKRGLFKAGYKKKV